MKLIWQTLAFEIVRTPRVRVLKVSGQHDDIVLTRGFEAEPMRQELCRLKSSSSEGVYLYEPTLLVTS